MQYSRTVYFTTTSLITNNLAEQSSQMKLVDAVDIFYCVQFKVIASTEQWTWIKPLQKEMYLTHLDQNAPHWTGVQSMTGETWLSCSFFFFVLSFFVFQRNKSCGCQYHSYLLPVPEAIPVNCGGRTLHMY